VRCLVSFWTEGNEHPFTVTADHSLIVYCPFYGHQRIQARDLVSDDSVSTHDRPRISSGSSYVLVTMAKFTNRPTEVVEVLFSGDQAVLAWMFPKRRSKAGKPRELRPDQGVSIPGAPGSSSDRMRSAGVVENNTFLDVLGARASARCLSDGDEPVGPTLFSRGSRQHSNGTCVVCEVHHRHLMDRTKPECKHGVDCVRCHLPHTELSFRPERGGPFRHRVSDSIRARCEDILKHPAAKENFFEVVD